MAEDARAPEAPPPAAKPEPGSSACRAGGMRDKARAEVLADPTLVLEDRKVMQALIDASDAPGGRKVIDLRGALVSRLEQRLDRLETTHRSVIAAAYDNLAGTSQVHKATLLLLDQNRFVDALRVLTQEAPDLLAVDCIRVCIETDEAPPGPMQGLEAELAEAVVVLPPGGVSAYFALSSGFGDGAGRMVALRQTRAEADAIFGDLASWVRSEALVRLDLGGGRRGLLAFGAEDSQRFTPDHGVDLLTFFGGVVERALHRWLAPDD